MTGADRKSKTLKGTCIFLFVISTILVVGYWQGLTTFVFAWVLNFMLMLGIEFFLQSFPIRLNQKYFLPRPWERSGEIYRILGVNLYRRLLVFIGWERLHKKGNPVNKKLEALRHLELNTRKSELGHLTVFLIVLVINLYVAMTYGFGKGMWLLTLNILLNAYPIMVQRYNRPRLLRLIRNMEAPLDFKGSTSERG